MITQLTKLVVIALSFVATSCSAHDSSEVLDAAPEKFEDFDVPLHLSDIEFDGAALLLDPQVSEFLALSDEQQSKLRSINTINQLEREEMQDILSRARYPDEETARALVQRYVEEARTRTLAVLTPEQVSALAGN